MPNDLLVMGLPRSGTTLLAALIDSSPEAVCLSEPKLPHARQVREHHAFVTGLASDMSDYRAAITAGVPVIDYRGDDGGHVTNYVARDAGGAGERIAERRPRLAAVTGTDFTLAVKLNGPFLATLPLLAAHGGWRTVALIRHPEACFLSWLHSGMPIAQGKFAVRYWPETAAIHKDAAMPIPEKLARIYEIAARRLAECPPWRLLRYEALRADPDAAMAAIGVAGADVSMVAGPTQHPRENAIAADALTILRAMGGSAARLYDL